MNYVKEIMIWMFALAIIIQLIQSFNKCNNDKIKYLVRKNIDKKKQNNLIDLIEIPSVPSSRRKLL